MVELSLAATVQFSLATVQSVLQRLEKSQRSALLECACSRNVIWGNEEPYEAIRRVSARQREKYEIFLGLAKHFKTDSTIKTVWNHIEKDEFHPLKPFVFDLKPREKVEKLLEVIKLSKNIYPLTMGANISIKALGLSRHVEKALLKKGCTLNDVLGQNLPKVRNFDVEQEIHIALKNIGLVEINLIDEDEVILHDIS